MKLEFSVISEKYSNVKCHENPSSGSRVIPRGQTDRRTCDEANNRFSWFCERAPINLQISTFQSLQQPLERISFTWKVEEVTYFETSKQKL